jgi:hypothetical protein
VARRIFAAPSNIYVLRKVKKAAEQALKRTRRDADTLRNNFLQELKRRIATRLAQKDTNVDAAIKNIDNQLRDNKRFSRIARTLKPNASPALTKSGTHHQPQVHSPQHWTPTLLHDYQNHQH